MVKRRQPTGISPSADEVAVIGQNNGREDYVDTSKLDRRFYQRTKKDAFMLSFVVATFLHICYTFIGGVSNRQPIHRKNLAAEAAALSRERLRAAADAIANQTIKQKEIPKRNFTNWQLKEEEQKEQLRAFREKRRKDGYKFRIKVN